MTEGEVDRLVTEAESSKGADVTRRDLAETRNQAEALLYTSENALKEYAEILPEELRGALAKDVATLRSAVDSNADLQTIKDAHAALEASAYRIAEAMYGGAGSTG